MPSPEVKPSNVTSNVTSDAIVDILSEQNLTQQSVDLGNDPTIMYCSPREHRNNKTAQARYHKQSKKQKLDDNRTRYL